MTVRSPLSAIAAPDGMQSQAGAGRPIRVLPVLAGLAGVIAAFCIVVAWFPSALWGTPIQGIDAPAHYYFVRKLLNHGPSVLLTLQSNDGFYPPLFHVCAALLVAIGGALGIPAFTGSMAVMDAVNCVWILGAGLLWPLGMLLLCRYFFRRASVVTRCMLAFAVPVLAVSSGANPYQMLYAGPLLSYGFASNLLPFLMLATLHFMDAITDTRAERNERNERLLKTGLLTLLAFVVVAGAQPKMMFTYILVMLPFVLVRLPWKLIAAVFAGLAVCAVGFFIFAVNIYKNSRYFHPEQWFHTHKPAMTLPTSLTYAFSDGMVTGDPAKGLISFNVPTVAGRAMIALLVFAIVAAIAAVVMNLVPFVPRSKVVRGLGAADRPDVALGKDALALLLAFGFVLFVFECGATLTGAIPNVVTAVWYRNEVRTMTMLPLGILPLIAFAGACLDRWVIRVRNAGDDSVRGGSAMAASAEAGRTVVVSAETPSAVASHAVTGSAMTARVVASRAVSAICASLMVAVLIGAQTVNPVKAMMVESLTNAASLEKSDPNEQLTTAKFDALKRMVGVTGTDALIISDPLNGSMYATALFNANMLYPVYNPQDTIHGQIFGQVERDFASGDSATMLGNACGINPSQPTYFLSMGPQAPSLEFQFKAQFNQFHDAALIAKYVESGALKPVATLDLTTYGDYAADWALYQLNCPAR
ncbi:MULTISPECIES: DUF6541 family protein [unclassified Bifidobacterium]|uniref:DUF6541 family protein n=1 Tax=unclassified Bifidobacterium TaxID=2608897 RepID=UPI00112AB712|nr:MULTISPECIES: DUF6541 family protein [unclassified Bifidobacterium]TPF77982.1 hypothetical protein BW09_06865 [Bifidobacterium sp. UTCIF-1]TPF80203.1 hypothetical protein BW08_06085 [Bifidobacterium sp. UTCIF-24]TPF83009.1 hypothetical protein BW12_01450 [Bifidobacterium sp. UTCIF-3]TPF83916.1 hypothetical protein BW07_07835 [Bifidobacterium sp. UTCIF-36]TPF90614.1 hypothetical protein BW10_02730 [Bifidobacterium sp. UTBIF-56]